MKQIPGIFSAVKRMNVAFGNREGDPLNIDWERLEKQVSNILGEWVETMSAMGIEVDVKVAVKSRDPSKRNVDGVRDGLCDINVFSLGGHHFMGYDADRDMQSVVDGVMTRFCKDERELADTMKKYADLGVSLYAGGATFPTIFLKSAKDQTGTNGEFYPKGKFVKSVGYKEPVFYQVQPPTSTPLNPPLPSSRFFSDNPAREPRRTQRLAAAVADTPRRRSTDVLPAAYDATPAQVETRNIIEELTSARTEFNDDWKRKQEAIERQVDEYRTKLETEAFGDIKPYNPREAATIQEGAVESEGGDL